MDPHERRRLLHRGAELSERALEASGELSKQVIERSADFSRRQAIRRTRRLKQRAYFIAQCALAAAVSYAAARYVFKVPVPLFAPVAAMVCLGMTYGQRLGRALEITAGVAVGVFIGEYVVHLFGVGIWQVLLIVSVAMTLAALLGAGTLMVTQAGIQGLIVALLGVLPNAAFGRWFEALIGCGVALLFATVVPGSELRKPRQKLGEVLGLLAQLLHSIAVAVHDNDRDAAEQVLAEARASEDELDALRGSTEIGTEIIRTSPFHRRRQPDVEQVNDVLEPIDRAVRNARVLIRRATISLQTGEQVPPSYATAVNRLATVVADVADTFTGEVDPVVAGSVADRLVDIGRHTADPDPDADLSAEVIRAQVRSMIVDLLQVLGRDFDEAQSLVVATR